MEDAIETMYWCHMCSRSVNPVIEGDIINCNFCQSGFVEETDNIQDSDTTDHHQSTDSRWAPILMELMNDNNNNTRNQTASESMVEDEEDDDDDDQNNDGETDLDRQVDELMRSRRRDAAAVLNLLQGVRAGLLMESDTYEDNPDSELAILIHSFSQRARVQDSIETSSVPSESLGDYFIGPGFETMLQRLAENEANNRYGTPPATKEGIESLAMVIIEESLLQCTVCMDDFEIGMVVKEMPCKHKFHSHCLLPWLELHSSCPVCRCLLPTRDDDDGQPKTDAETSVNNDDMSIDSMESNGSGLDPSLNNSSAN